VPTYRTPGVYFEWLDTAPRGIASLRTDIAGFVGIATRGPLHEATKIETWPQFVSTFGAHTRQGHLAYAVEGFFANGGDTCYVVRVADPEAARCARLDLVDRDGSLILGLIAASAGVWAHTMDVAAIPAANGRFTLVLNTADGLREIWPNLSPDRGDPRYAGRLLADKQTGSTLIRAGVSSGADGGATARLAITGQIGRMAGGADGLASLRAKHLVGPGNPPLHPLGLEALEASDPVSIVAIPDLMIEPAPVRERAYRARRCEPIAAATNAAALLSTRATAAPDTATESAPALTSEEILDAQGRLIGHCEALRDRVALLDTSLADVTPALAIQRRERFSTSYAALYYPWLRVPDPLQLDGPLRPVPPSGHLAGILARGDRRFGVAKPPANEVVDLAQDVNDPLDGVTHAELNDHHVNAIRAYPGRGIRIMGARTLCVDAPWRFLNVRRLFAMIEEAIDEQTQWAVFEPNNRDLWRDLERAARGFLTGLWRSNMLDGATESDAFSVTCDESTNPPDQIASGRMTCRIGLQPPLPAEFIIARLGKSERGTEIVAAQGVSHA
jgi:phage tail sheath protein FI